MFKRGRQWLWAEFIPPYIRHHENAYEVGRKTVRWTEEKLIAVAQEKSHADILWECWWTWTATKAV